VPLAPKKEKLMKGVTEDDVRSDWTIENGSFDYLIKEKLHKQDTTAGFTKKEVNDDGASTAQKYNKKSIEEVHEMEEATATEAAQMAAMKDNASPVYDAEAEVEAFGPNTKDVNGKTYGEELKEARDKAAKEEAKKKAILEARLKKRNAEMAKYEKKDDQMFSKAFSNIHEDHVMAEKRSVAEAAAGAHAIMYPKPDLSKALSPAPPPYKGPGKNIDCDEATGDYEPGNECGDIRQPSGEPKMVRDMADTDNSVPLPDGVSPKEDTLNGVGTGAFVPGSGGR
jgi:hypothetical protein